MIADRKRSFAAAAGVAFVLATSFSCGGGSSPIIPPTPPPTTPTTAPTSPPAGASNCPFGKGTENSSCEKLVPTLTDQVGIAIDKLIASNPTLFNFDEESGGKGSGLYRVKDRQAYYDGVLANLKAAGMCSDYDYDLGENIQVKNSSEYSETIAIYLSTGYIRRGNRAYIETCTPAAFPVAPGPDTPPRGSGCGKPYPPEISKMKFYIHLSGAEPWTLDSTPIVGPNPEYCASIGYNDRFDCPMRNPGDPSRIPCELWRVGNAEDTGQPGPTFRRNGQFCTGPASGCEHHPENPFSLLDYKGGDYQVCAANGICADLVVGH